MSAHDELGDLLLSTHIPADRMVDLLARVRKEQRAQFRDDSIPEWEAAYDSATFTPYLIGYLNDEVSAKAAALAWYRANCETDDTLDWEPEPNGTTGEWDRWDNLIRTRADGMLLATDIVVRRRKASSDTTYATTRGEPGEGQ